MEPLAVEIDNRHQKIWRAKSTGRQWQEQHKSAIYIRTYGSGLQLFAPRCTSAIGENGLSEAIRAGGGIAA